MRHATGDQSLVVAVSSLAASLPFSVPLGKGFIFEAQVAERFLKRNWPLLLDFSYNARHQFLLTGSHFTVSQLPLWCAATVCYLGRPGCTASALGCPARSLGARQARQDLSGPSASQA